MSVTLDEIYKQVPICDQIEKQWHILDNVLSNTEQRKALVTFIEDINRHVGELHQYKMLSIFHGRPSNYIDDYLAIENPSLIWSTHNMNLQNYTERLRVSNDWDQELAKVCKSVCFDLSSIDGGETPLWYWLRNHSSPRVDYTELLKHRCEELFQLNRGLINSSIFEAAKTYRDNNNYGVLEWFLVPFDEANKIGIICKKNGYINGLLNIRPITENRLSEDMWFGRSIQLQGRFIQTKIKPFLYKTIRSDNYVTMQHFQHLLPSQV